MAVVCAQCRQLSAGGFPRGVGVGMQYGPEVQALAVVLHFAHFPPYARTAELLDALLGDRPSAGSLVRCTAAAARACVPAQRVAVSAIGPSATARGRDHAARGNAGSAVLDQVSRRRDSDAHAVRTYTPGAAARAPRPAACGSRSRRRSWGAAVSTVVPVRLVAARRRTRCGYQHRFVPSLRRRNGVAESVDNRPWSSRRHRRPHL